MSEKAIAQSKSKRRMGCKAASTAISGFFTIPKKPYFCFKSLYSGKYLPACLIIHIGGRGTLSPPQAARKSSLEFFGELDIFIFS